MATTYDEFPHHGDHLKTDEKQAELTIELLIAFVLATAVFLILAWVG